MLNYFGRASRLVIALMVFLTVGATVDAATIYWDGGGDTLSCGSGAEDYWGCPENWLGDVVPADADDVIINMVDNIDLDGFVEVNSIVFDSATLVQNGTLVVTDFTLNSGSWDQNGEDIELFGDWTRNGGTFTPNFGTITLDTDNDQTISGSNTFGWMRIYNSFYFTDKTVTFEAGETQTFEDTLTVEGDIIDLFYVRLRSSNPGSQWFFDGDDGDFFDNWVYADVQDANFLDTQASGNTVQASFGMVDSGNNTNIDFFSLPAAPTNLGQTEVIDGSTILDDTPDLQFDITNSGPCPEFFCFPTKYILEVSTDESFSTKVIEYRSEFGDLDGSQTFTVGQVEGSDPGYEIPPEYCGDPPCTGTNAEYFDGQGNSGQTLADGDYFWRVRVLNDQGMLSEWSEGFSSPTQSFSLGEGGGPETVPEFSTYMMIVTLIMGAYMMKRKGLIVFNRD